MQSHQTLCHAVSCLLSHLVGDLIFAFWYLPPIVTLSSTYTTLSLNHLLTNDRHLTFYVYFYLLTCSLSVFCHWSVNSTSGKSLFCSLLCLQCLCQCLAHNGTRYLLKEWQNESGELTSHWYTQNLCHRVNSKCLLISSGVSHKEYDFSLLWIWLQLSTFIFVLWYFILFF